MNKLLTIIVPACNMESYLEKCLSSLIVRRGAGNEVNGELLEQLEVLVVNDGSKDRTSEIAHEFEIRYPGVFKVIDKPNGHYGSCVNRALSVAQGEYVKLLDADDYFDTIQWEKFLEALIAGKKDGKLDEVDALVSDYGTVDETGKILSTKTYAYPIREAFGMEVFQAELGFHILHQGIAYRRSILVDCGYRQTEGCAYTDLEWVTIPMHCVDKFFYLPYSIYRYLIGREGQSVQQKQFAGNVNIILRLVGGMLKRYPQLLDVSRPAVQQYVDKVLLAQLGIIYHAYLLEGRKHYSVQELRELDALLRQTSPELYKASDFTVKSRWFTYHYVKNFRQAGLWNWIKRRLFFAYVALAAGR